MGRNLIRRTVISVAAAGMAVTLAGCGGEQIAEEVVERQMEEALGTAGGDVEIDVNEDGEGSVTVEGEDGDTTFSFGGSDVPEGFPAGLLPEGAEIESASDISSGEGSLQMVSVGSDQPLSELFGFYLGAVADAGFEVTQQTQSTTEGTESFSVMGESDGATVLVTGFTDSGRSMISVTVTSEATP